MVTAGGMKSYDQDIRLMNTASKRLWLKYG